jgi:hypothetical protein
MIRMISLAVVLVSAMIPSQKAMAQSANTAATQIVTLQLEPVIQISAATSGNVKLGFNNINNYISGVTSGSQQFTVHSNKEYVVSVKTSAASFSYSGNAYPTPFMPVDDILFLAVTNNNTGGSVGHSFANFTSLSNTPKELLLNCKNGGNKSFSINYKANPGPQFPAGDYSVGVIYTATQP